jgi:hypothetical protein
MSTSKSSQLVSAYWSEPEEKSGEIAWHMWWARIRACQRYRSEHPFGEQRWQRWYDLYKGIQWEDLDDLYDISSDNLPERVTVNITASSILTMVPFLVNSNAKYNCEPRTPEQVVAAMLKEKIINYEFEHRECNDQLRRVVYDGTIIGHGIVKSGFTVQVDESVRAAVGTIEYDEMIEDESFFLKRKRPFDFWFDYSAPECNLATARFCFERYHKYVADVVENTSYKKSIRDKIKRGDYGDLTGLNSNEYGHENEGYDWLKGEDYTLDSGVATFYEVWDKRFNQVLTFCEGILEPLRVIDNPYPYLKGMFPYIQYDYIYLPDEPWGCGIPRFTEAQQYEINRHRTFGLNHRRKASARIYEVHEDVDNDEKEKLPEAEDVTFIEVPEMGLIKPVPDLPLSPDYPLYEAVLKSDFNELTGLDALARGERLQSRATLGEVNARGNILGLKINERVKEVDRLFLKSGKHASAHIGANYYKTMVVRLVGLQGEFWVQVNHEDIKDEIDISMETVSAPQRDPNVDMQQRLQGLQVIMQNALPLIQAGAIPPDEINFVEVLKWFFEGFERVDVGRFFKSALVPVNPLSQFMMTTGDLQSMLNSPEAQREQQAQNAATESNTIQDLVRSLASGNRSGLQVSGVG